MVGGAGWNLRLSSFDFHSLKNQQATGRAKDKSDVESDKARFLGGVGSLIVGSDDSDKFGQVSGEHLDKSKGKSGGTVRTESTGGSIGYWLLQSFYAVIYNALNPNEPNKKTAIFFEWLADPSHRNLQQTTRLNHRTEIKGPDPIPQKEEIKGPEAEKALEPVCLTYSRQDHLVS